MCFCQCICSGRLLVAGFHFLLPVSTLLAGFTQACVPPPQHALPPPPSGVTTSTAVRTTAPHIEAPIFTAEEVDESVQPPLLYPPAPLRRGLKSRMAASSASAIAAAGGIVRARGRTHLTTDAKDAKAMPEASDRSLLRGCAVAVPHPSALAYNDAGPHPVPGCDHHRRPSTYHHATFEEEGDKEDDLRRGTAAASRGERGPPAPRSGGKGTRRYPCLCSLTSQPRFQCQLPSWLRGASAAVVSLLLPHCQLQSLTPLCTRLEPAAAAPQPAPQPSGDVRQIERGRKGASQ